MIIQDFKRLVYFYWAFVKTFPLNSPLQKIEFIPVHVIFNVASGELLLIFTLYNLLLCLIELGVARQQAITWTNVDQFPYRHMVSLANEFTTKQY